MSRSLKKKAIVCGVLCLALVLYDVVSSLRRGWDWESLVKDTLLVGVSIYFIRHEQRFYTRLAAMSSEQRDRELAAKIPVDRAKILSKLKEYDA